MEALKNSRVSVAEYLKIEAEAHEKYEYHDGFLYAMAGGTYNHGLICGNIFGELRNRLMKRDDDCIAMSIEGMDNKLALNALDLEIDFQQIYYRVAFE